MPMTDHDAELLDLYRREAAESATELEALEYLVTVASRDAEAGKSFDVLSGLPGDRAAFDLRAKRDEARRDAALCAGRLERMERAQAAGVHRYAAPCECGHTGFKHARTVTEDGRIPCDETACRCDDLTFVAAV